MKIFHSSIFIKQETLNDAGIKHPIKVEYYKIISEDEVTKNKKAKFGIDVVKTEYMKINEDEVLKQEKAKFGIKVIKTEYKKDNVEIENKELHNISSDEEKIEEILKILKDNEVTPIILEDVLNDISKQYILV